MTDAVAAIDTAIRRARPYPALPTSGGAELPPRGLVHANHLINDAHAPAKEVTELANSQYFKEFSNSTQGKQITILNIDTEEWKPKSAGYQP